MKKETNIILFEDKKIRREWIAKVEKWYFSIVDVIEVLTESHNPSSYWKVLKNRLKKEGNQLVTNCNQLKMQSADGKYYKTDVADVEQLFRIIQSIPSHKAEPFKLWLAQLGRERLEEIEDPEAGIQRAMEYYYNKGYSEGWINQRLKSIEIRKELTDEWKQRGVKGHQYPTLTDIITKEWAGMTTKQYKYHKEIKKAENLRDNMTNMELILNMLAEATTTEISKKKEPKTFEQNIQIAQQGGEIAGNTRKEIEAKTGKKIISKQNARTLKAKEIKNIEKIPINNKTNVNRIEKNSD